jgi:eukaryotic-like serine/threonine-protein kinase
MAITDPLILPAGVVFVPVENLPPDTREQIGCEHGDYVITRPRSRTPSRVIDTQTVELLKEFQTPKTIVEAVLHYSKMRKADPEQTLEETFPVIQNFLDSRLLVPAASGESDAIIPSFDIGDQVATYEILRCVHVLEDTELYQVRCVSGKLAALKMLRSGSEGRMQRFFDQEIAVLNHLDGSISPALLEKGKFADWSYLITTWCPGVDVSLAAAELRHDHDKTDRKQLLQLCCAILDAYSRLHAQQVIHSDIHPHNVLAAGDGSITIIDYGFARLESAEHELDVPPRGGVGFFFEPEYAEAVLAGRQPPKSSMLGEQYALAAMVYFLLTGAHYLNFSLEKREMLRQIVEDSPLPFLSRGLQPWPAVEQTLAKALNKKPSNRFSSVAALADRLKEIVLADEQSDAVNTKNLFHLDTQETEQFLGRVLQNIGWGGSLLSSGLTTAPTCSVNHGAAGIAYALYRLACIREDATWLALADIWITKAVCSIGNELAFYNGDIDLTPQKVGQVSPYHTTSGVHCVRALVSHAMGDFSSQQEAVEAFVAASRAPCENLDLTLGRSGTLLACSLLLDTMSVSDILNSTRLRALGDETMQDIWNKLNSFPPIRECSEVMYLGIAHGWAGMLYTTMRWCQSSGRVLPNGIEGRLHQLAEYAEPIGRGLRWRWVLPTYSGKTEAGYMPGWCNGSAGYVHLWTLAHQMFGNEAYFLLAEKAAWNTWEEPRAIDSLCCGLAGRAYGLLNLYKHTDEKSWLHRAQQLASGAIDRRGSASRASNPASPLDTRSESLYRGDMGIAVLVAELSRPEVACMPFFEREG